MKQKTHKALASRLKRTAKGKLLKRTCGQDHYNGRENGKTTRNKRSDKTFSKAHRKAVETLLPYHK